MGRDYEEYQQREELHPACVLDVWPVSHQGSFNPAVDRCRTFGQLLLVHSFFHNRDQRLRDLLPEGWERWTIFAVRLLQDFSSMSPSVARDAEIAAALFPGPT